MIFKVYLLNEILLEINVGQTKYDAGEFECTIRNRFSKNKKKTGEVEFIDQNQYCVSIG